MNSQANMSLLRSLLQVVSGLLVGYGLGTADQWSHIIGDILVVVPAAVSVCTTLWSIYSHYRMVKVPEDTPVIPPNDVLQPAKIAVKEGTL